MKSLWKKIVLGLMTLLLIAQLIPTGKTNPEVTAEFSENQSLKAIFKRSCYDCHSNETNWPWYSDVAPISWLVVHDVKEGRKHLNFSTWNDLPPKKKEHKKEEILEQIEKGEMPMTLYTFIHRNAKLLEAEKGMIKTWVVADTGKTTGEEENR